MAKYVAKQILLEVANTAGDAFVEVSQVASIDLPQTDTEEVEVTTLDNEDDTREFLQGFKDGGECTLELVFDPAQHFTPNDSVWKLYKSGDTREWRLALPAAMALRYVWSAYVKAAGLQAIQPGQAIRMNATLRVSGSAADFEAVA